MTKFLLKSNRVSSLEEWETAFKKHDSKPEHWKPGRSACSLAEFCLKHQGIELITNVLKANGVDTEPFEKARIENGLKFDNDGRHTSVRDLVLSSPSAFLTIEAKVDESFDKNLKDSLKDAEKYLLGHPKSYKKERLKGLCRQLLKKDLEDISDVNNLRYQLLQATAATLANARNAQVPVMMVLVFKTKGYGAQDYNKEKGDQNYADFCRFMEAIHADEVKDAKSVEGADTHAYRATLKYTSASGEKEREAAPEREMLFLYTAVDLENK